MVEINYCLNKDDAKLYHISQIGNRKNIFCPECNGELIAAKGEVYQHHFRHKNTDDCNRGEGALHKYVKQQISEKKYIYLNGIRYDFKEVDEELPVKINENQYFIDVSGRLNNGNQIFIEVCVTHNLL